MQYSFLTAVALATAALAAPFTSVETRQNGAGLNPDVVFTNATCQLPDRLLDPALRLLLPTSNRIGNILIGPILKATLGPVVIDDIDKVAEDICVSANQDKDDDVGICDNVLQLIFDFAQRTNQDAADHFRCLLNFLCVAQNSPNNDGTCQKLLAGVDCIANRLVGVGDKECTGKYFPSG